MQKETSNTSVRQTLRHLLRDAMTLLSESLIWTGCAYVAALSQDGLHTDAAPPFVWYIYLGWGLAMLFVATRIIHSNTYSRTARRDEVVACAMKTALAVSVLSFAVFTERTSFLYLTCIFFFVALTAVRLILNSWFIRYALRHNEHGVIISDEETAWQQKALQQNTYGLKLSHMEMPSAQQLEEYLAVHPETESVYCAPSSLSAAELEDVAHTCRKQRIVFHLLPIATSTLPQTMQSECRGAVSVLSPAKSPLQNVLNRSAKRLTDIALSLIILLTVFPVFTLIAFIFIKKQSRGPVLTTRHMCGMDGKTFLCLTFRTRHYEAAPSFLEGINDPGYFPFGRFLKHSRMELLPQFLCVLWGSMTIVGSQSMRPEQYAEYRREVRHLFVSGNRLKAGITSYQFPSQSKGSTKADAWYCHNWGYWLDVRIMLQRLATLLRKSKATSINYI